MQNSGIKGLSVALAIHGVAFGALFIMGVSGGNESAASDADPILLMLPGKDDPTKDAGIVGNERGIAKGTKDGKLFDPGKYTEERLEKIADEDKKLAKEAEAARQKAEQKAAEEREQAKEDKPSQERTTPATNSQKPTQKQTKGKGDGVEKRQLVSTRDLIKNRGKSGGKTSGGNKKDAGKGISGVRIGTENILGNATGTGGNGGDGGSRVADARQIYAKAVEKVFTPHFENVVAQNPVSIPQSITVDVRFSVDGRGNIKFLEVIGSSDPQLRDRIKKAFSTAFPSKFQTPPNGESFTGRLNGITFVVD